MRAQRRKSVVLFAALLLLSGTTITDNETGIDSVPANPGTIYTIGNNRVFNNGGYIFGKPNILTQQF